MGRKEEKPNSEKRHYFLDSEEEKEVEEVDNNYTLCSLREKKRLNHVVHVSLNKERMKIEVDKDGAMSVIGDYTYKTLKNKQRLLELKETKRYSTHITRSK